MFVIVLSLPWSFFLFCLLFALIVIGGRNGDALSFCHIEMLRAKILIGEDFMLPTRHNCKGSLLLWGWFLVVLFGLISMILVSFVGSACGCCCISIRTLPPTFWGVGNGGWLPGWLANQFSFRLTLYCASMYLVGMAWLCDCCLRLRTGGVCFAHFFRSLE